MKLITYNATASLFEKAEELAQEPHESWRCIHFNFANTSERSNQELYSYFVLSPITTMLEAYSGYIYVCDDRDIFILFQGALRPVATKLSQHFGDIDPEAFLTQSDSTFVHMYDLAKQWDEFYALCETRYYKGIALDEMSRTRFIFRPISRIYAEPKPF